MKLIFILLVMPLFGMAQLTTHSRGAGMGDVGIAVANGNQQLGYNVGKTVFTNHFHQASITYLPYLRALFNDTKFIRADYLKTMGESTTVGLAINLLDLGNLTIRDDYGASLAVYRNVQYNLGSSVGVRISESSGIGATIRLLGARQFDGGGPFNRYGVSGDINYYQSFNKFSLGAVINHLGSEIWQPAEMGIGFGYADHDDTKSWSVGFDVRKPIKSSFAAARYSVGAEIGVQESFFIRSGFSLEHRDNGNRKYFSLGTGYKGFVEDQSWGIDLHYLIPFGLRSTYSPIQYSYGLSLYLNIGSF